MKLQDLKFGDKFRPVNNKNLICIKRNEVLVGRRHLISCKSSSIGIVNLPMELEVIKCEM